ncbi:MAG: SpoVG family protein [Candidatus Omnitrophota bacterium]|nr:SpoVG family protein [Candidatus Omnitrophota bacterium]
MKITEVRIFPTESKDGKLKAFATMTFDDWFVVRNVKVIQGNNGLFVAMPSRKAMDSCPKCNFKNVRGSKYCNQCGAGLSFQLPDESSEKQSNHMDIAHPITQECRVYIQDRILDAFKREGKKQAAEGSSYKPMSDEDLSTAVDKLAEGVGADKTDQSAAISEMESGKDIEL